MNRKAFTLVELLVCIAIVGVLANLVFSAARSALDASKTTVCTSNLHQLAGALDLYQSDYGVYPISNDRFKGLMPYLGYTPLLCPYRLLALNPNTPPRFADDYFINGFDGNLTTQAELACQQTRGSSFPIAFDANHCSPYVARVTGKSFYIYARVDGSVAREDWKQEDDFLINPSGYPCPEAPDYYNFR